MIHTPPSTLFSRLRSPFSPTSIELLLVDSLSFLCSLLSFLTTLHLISCIPILHLSRQKAYGRQLPPLPLSILTCPLRTAPGLRSRAQWRLLKSTPHLYAPTQHLTLVGVTPQPALHLILRLLHLIQKLKKTLTLTPTPELLTHQKILSSRSTSFPEVQLPASESVLLVPESVPRSTHLQFHVNLISSPEVPPLALICNFCQIQLLQNLTRSFFSRNLIQNHHRLWSSPPTAPINRVPTLQKPERSPSLEIPQHSPTPRLILSLRTCLSRQRKWRRKGHAGLRMTTCPHAWYCGRLRVHLVRVQKTGVAGASLLLR